MSKIHSAESIRGLACLVVVFSHLALTFTPSLHNFYSLDLEPTSLTYWIYHSPFGFFYSGTASVFVFFVLSGYVLSHAILKETNIDQKIKRMALKRYPRLAIPALVSCFIAWLLFKLNIDSSSTSEWFQRYGNINEPLYLIIHDGLFNSFILGESTYNWVLWTMQIELFGSLILFTLLYFFKINRTFFHFLAIFLPLFFLINTSQKFSLGIYSFVIGMYIYLYGKKITIAPAISLLILGLYLAGVHTTSNSYKFFYLILGSNTYILLCFVSGSLIVYSILMCDSVSKKLDNTFLVFLGKISFSIYLLHMILIYAIGVPVFNSLNKFDHNTSVLISCASTLVATVVFSVPYSNFIDRLSINLSNKIAEKYKF